jgi:hypothetical protein
MGIYETKSENFNRDRTVLTINRDPGYGEIIVESWIKICEIRDRQTCFCCSCGEREGTDIACRNHGWAASRPCETHGMPGTPWGEEMCADDCPGSVDKLMIDGKEIMEISSHKEDCLYGKMPSSVEAERKNADG